MNHRNTCDLCRLQAVIPVMIKSGTDLTARAAANRNRQEVSRNDAANNVSIPVIVTNVTIPAVIVKMSV